METLSLNCSITFYEDLRLVGIGDATLGKNKPLEITSDPIGVVVTVGAIILDRPGEKW